MITSETNRTQSVGNGGSTYAYGFKVWSDADIQVYRSNIASPTEKVLGTLTTHYTVGSVGVSGGGNITLAGAWAASPPDDTEHITCILNMEYKQEVDIENQGSPEGNTIERMFDKVTSLALQLKGQYDRCFKVDEVSAEDPEDMTLESVRDAPTDVTSFGHNLSGADDTIQKALDTLDDDAANKANMDAALAARDLRMPVLIDEAIVSSGAVIDVWGDLSGYDSVEVEIKYVTLESPATSQDIRLRFLDDAGDPVTGSNYEYAGTIQDCNGGSSVLSGNAAAYVLLATDVYDHASYGLSGRLCLLPDNLIYSRGWGHMTWRDSNHYVTNEQLSVGYSALISSPGGVRLYNDDSTLTGTVRLWGLPTGS